jgi:hypothetical protein
MGHWVNQTHVQVFAWIRTLKFPWTSRQRLAALWLLALGTLPLFARNRVWPSHSPHASRAVPTSISGSGGSLASGGSGKLALNRETGKAYSQLPMGFEVNRGQAPLEVQFLSRGSGYGLFLTADGAILELSQHRRDSHGSSRLSKFLGEPPQARPVEYKLSSNQSEPNDAPVTTLRLRLMGANPAVRPIALSPLPGKNNYFIGSNPAKWNARVRTYARVSYPEIYPGIELAYYGNQRRLEYDFILAPGAALESIAWQLRTNSGLVPTMKLDRQGNLLVSGRSGTVALKKPVAYEIDSNQTGVGARHALEAFYVLEADGQFGFSVPNHDSTKTLVVDPVVEYSTYLGGSADDEAWGIAVDASGNIYVTGQTLSTNFPVQNAAQTSCASCTATVPEPDAFIVKFDSTGTSLAYSTYLGGAAADAAFGIAVDSAGNALVTGATLSTDFPVTAGAFQSTCPSCASKTTPLPDAFVAKLDPTGSVVYATYLGGSGNDQGLAIATDSVGNAYVTGLTTSSGYYTVNPLPAPDNNLRGAQNSFVARFDPTGKLLSSTYLGGSDTDSGNGIAVDASGIYVVGETDSNNFPTVNAYQATFAGATDGFISKLKPDGSNFLYSTYFGGPAQDAATAIAIDSAGNAYITGWTASTTSFPLTPGAFQTTYGGGANDAFVAKLNAEGALTYSTYVGGSNGDAAYGIGVVDTSTAPDSLGTVNIVGQTTSTDLPTASPIQKANEGNTDAFVTRLVPTGCGTTLSTYLGGHSSDFGQGIAVDASGNAYVTGRTSSNDFLSPLTNPYQATTGGSFDAFLVRLNSFKAPSVCVSPSTLTFSGQALTTTSPAQQITITNGGSVNLNVTGVAASGSFQQTNTCSSLNPGGNCNISVTFAPTSAGRNTGSISITDDAGGSPQSLAVQGVGTDFNLSISPPTAAITAGQQASFTLTVTPLNGFSSAVALTCGGAPQNGNCSFSSSSITLDGTTSATSTISVGTAATSQMPEPWSPRIIAPSAGPRFYLLLFSVLAILVAQILRRLKDLKAVSYGRLSGFVGLLLISMCLSSCGFQNSAPKGTPAGNYSVTVTATQGTLQHSTKAVLTVN